MRSIMRAHAAAGIVLSLALVATACSSDDPAVEDDPAADAPAEDDPAEDDPADADPAAGDAMGTVPIAGSSTVFPIATLVAEDVADASGIDVAIQSTGSSGGFRDHFCQGTTAINNSSREINDSDIEQCAENGVENILEIKVGIDGMTVMTAVDNDAIGQCLNFNELYAIAGPESGAVASWADANAIVDELGGGVSAPFDDVPLTTAGPGTESGTYDSFIEIALEGIGEGRLEEGHITEEDGFIRPDWQGNNDDNLIIEAIAGNPYSWGWVGYAYYLEVQDQIRAFEIAADDTSDCVAPTPETIASGEYPLSRALYMYVNLDKLEGENYSDALVTYLDYVVSDAGYELVAEAGYVQLEPADWEAEAAGAWAARESNI